MEKLESERICTNGNRRLQELHAERRRFSNAFFGALVVSVLFICATTLISKEHYWAGAGFFATGLIIWLSVAYDRSAARA